MVPNALSGIPLLVCPVKHRQLHKGNAIHLNNQTKHGMSHFCQWLWFTCLFQSPLTTCIVTVDLFSVSRNPQGVSNIYSYTNIYSYINIYIYIYTHIVIMITKTSVLSE